MSATKVRSAKTVLACVRSFPNQSMPRVRIFADQLYRGSDFRIYPGQVRLRTLPLSASCFAIYLLVRRRTCSAVPSSLLYTSVFVTVNTQSLSKQHLTCLSLGAQPILEATREYCCRLVFIGIKCGNPLRIPQVCVIKW